MKIKLPKEVGLEIDEYKSKSYGFEDYYIDLINLNAIEGAQYVNSKDNPLESLLQIMTLLQAWCYGWEEE